VDAVELDLRGVRCPLTWARAKVRLASLVRGATLVLLVDDPRSVRDVPRAAEAAGHVVGVVNDDGPPWRITIEA
jgi:tRNA 2-thiouridine synthesizing protein A